MIKWFIKENRVFQWKEHLNLTCYDGRFEKLTRFGELIKIYTIIVVSEFHPKSLDILLIHQFQQNLKLNFPFYQKVSKYISYLNVFLILYIMSQKFRKCYWIFFCADTIYYNLFWNFFNILKKVFSLIRFKQQIMFIF